MTYFLTALYYEAESIISQYKMKKVMEAAKFQAFKGQDEVLVISGIGALKSVVAATYLLDFFKYKENDIFINIGVCGGNREGCAEGDVFLCNKLIDSYNNKTFYPDILFKHPFKEGTLESFSETADSETVKNIKFDVADQEGTFVYEAVSMFLKPHNIHIIKIVSDILNPEEVTPEKIKKLMEGNLPQIYSWVEKRENIEAEEEEVINKEEKGILMLLSENLHLTSAMNRELFKLSKQYKVRNGKFMDIINEYTEIKCQAKNEGKRIFGQIKNRLMEL